MIITFGKNFRPKIKESLEDFKAWAKLPSPTKAEKNREAIFRQKIRRLQEKNLTENTESWENNRIILQKKILQSDPRNFLKWNIITYTMFHQARPIELEYLQKNRNWKKWEKAIIESKAGNPNPYPSFPQSSGNLIHHAYSLCMILDLFNKEIASFDTIFEFGGGYGSMCRLTYNLGFMGNYVIYDLPEFIALQEYFLTSLSLPTAVEFEKTSEAAPSISLLSKIPPDFKNKNNKKSLFVATWSLSETPVELRQTIFKSLPNFDCYLIAFQEQFEKIDNTAYFKKFAQSYPNHDWHELSIDHLNGNRYLFGKRKE
jgi:hypothetical protein